MNKSYNIQEISSGNLNQAFIIKSLIKKNRSIFIKQSLPYIKVLGKDALLDKNRIQNEIKTFKIYEKIAPNYIPKIYHTDEKMCAIIMQNLEKAINLRDFFKEEKNHNFLLNKLHHF